MRATAEVPGAAVAERLGATAGEVAAELQSETVAGESDTTVPDAAGRQLPDDHQAAVLQMGSYLQGRHDDRGRNRPAGTSQRDHRAEHHELPRGGGQEESTGRKPERGRMRRPLKQKPAERELWK